MKILVTGAKGFVGKNLCAQLNNIKEGKAKCYGDLVVDEVFEYDIDSTSEQLEYYCQQADFVFNLAGVNRPRNQEEFMKGNFGFASILLDTLFETACSTALEENPKLKVLNFGKPEQSLDDQGNYTATSTMTVVPEFELPEYKGIEVKVPSSEVTEADVEEALNSLAEQIAEFTPVDRAAQKDDVAVIDFKTTLDGKPVAEAVGKPVGFLEGRDGQWMKVEDDQFLPGFASALEGLNAGDSKDITVTIPDTFPITELRGKELVFHATVKEVREKQLPAMDDAFAEKVLPGKNLEELKTALKENLADRKSVV